MGRTWIGPAVGTALVLAALAARAQVATPWGWLATNVALAWVPVALGALATRSPAALALVGPAWLLFLPNAPYLVTDLVHLAPRRGVPFWFDAVLLGGAGALGLGLGAVSLRSVSEAAGRWIHPAAAWTAWLTIPALSGLGMAIGRVQRWNSWSVLTSPGELAADALALLASPRAHADVWAMAIAFGAVFAAAATFAPPAPAPSAAPSQR